MTKISFRYLLLFVFPAAFLILQILLKLDYRFFFLSAHDPAYGYLFNGLNLARGNMQLGLSAHPGTPLTCLVALNIVVINLFSVGSHLPDAVLNNPEFYLNIISYEIVAINTVALALLGIITFRRIHNLPLSLALQLTPFVSLQGFSFNSMVMLEPLLLSIEIFLVLLLSVYTFGRHKRLEGRALMAIAGLIALGIATKIVAVPLLFLPWFTLERLRDKVMYLGITVIALMIFLIPVYQVFPSFFTWIRALFMHTGKYGSGNPGFIDISVLRENLRLIFTSNYLFTTCFLISAIIAVLSWLPRFRSRMLPEKRNLVLGLTVVFLLNVTMVAKHYSNHYLMVSYNLIVFGGILLLSVFTDWKVMKPGALASDRIKIAMVFAAGAMLIGSLVHGIHFSPALKNPRLKALEFTETIKNTPRIIVLENSGPFIETALFHGFAYSGGMRPLYAKILKAHYPGTYFYNVAQDVFHDWIREFNLVGLLSGSSKTYLYYASKKDTIPPLLMARLNKLNQGKEILSLRTAYKNPAVREYIYEIDVHQPSMTGKIKMHEGVFCDFEDAVSDTAPVYETKSIIKFEKTPVRSEEKAYSGKFSIKLNQENPYGPGTKIMLKKGYFEITAMRNSEDGDGFIVAADKTGAFYKANAFANAGTGGWESLGLTVDVPEQMEGQEISVYLWYPGKGNCFFDDIRITWFEIL